MIVLTFVLVCLCLWCLGFWLVADGLLYLIGLRLSVSAPVGVGLKLTG